MDSQVLSKFDPRSRQAVAEGTLLGEVELQIRAEAPLHEEEVQRLKVAGYRLYSVSGPFASGAAQAAQLTDIAALPFVEQLELSKDLYAEDF